MNQLKTFDVAAVRADFPILARTVHGKPLVYLDNGASAQKPRCVIESLRHTYEHEYSNVHRAAHELSNATTEKFEASRRTVQKFLNAPEDREVIFLRGTTEAVNLVSNTYGRANLKPGDRSADYGHGAPQQHRALADDLRTNRREAGGRADGQNRHADPA